MSRRLTAVAAAACLLAAVSCGTGPGSALATPPARATATGSPPPSPSNSPTSVPSPVPSPPPDYGPPPAGVDLLYLQDPGAPTWLVGYDWEGTPRATVHLKELDGHTDQVGSGIVVAPNGSAFLGGAYTFDRLGHVVYQSPVVGKGGSPTTWSEDGQLLCGVDEATSNVDSGGNGTADFYFVRRTPTGPAVRVVNFLHLNEVPGDMGYSVYACSHWLDRALLVRTVCCGIQGAIVIRISDGAILGRWDRDAGSPVFSPDGQEVADPTTDAQGNVLSTEVRLLLGGTVLARYGPGVSFLGFSGNNRLAAASVSAGGETKTEVIEVSTRRVVWSDPLNRPLSRVVARPGSGDLALAFTAAPAQVPCPLASTSMCTNPRSNVVIIHPVGSSADLAGDVIVPMSWV